MLFGEQDTVIANQSADWCGNPFLGGEYGFPRKNAARQRHFYSE